MSVSRIMLSNLNNKKKREIPVGGSFCEARMKTRGKLEMDMFNNQGNVSGLLQRFNQPSQQHSHVREFNPDSTKNHYSHEVSISSARASVMVYDDVNKKWVPSGSSAGLSKVQLYHHQVNNTYRVVGRKLQDHEIVINCAILRGLKYNQATNTFHQWRDNKQVYGLNFSNKDDADAFAKAMLQALDMLSNGNNISRSLGPAAVLTTQQQPIYQQHQQPVNTQFDEDMGYSDNPELETRSMTRDDVAIIQERRMSQQNQATNGHNAISPSLPSISSQQQAQQQQQQPQQSGHHRTSSAPPAPSPQASPAQNQQVLPPIPGVLNQPQQMQPQPPPPQQPPAAPPAPPCPPAPMMNFGNNGGNSPGLNQYAQSQQSGHSSAAQSQTLCGTVSPGNQYVGTAIQPSNQFVGAQVGQMGQYSGSQGNLYGSSGAIYGQANNQPASQYSQASTPSGHGYPVANQYGSNGSINQYAQVQPQYASVAPSQATAQSQYVQSAGAIPNPYGTPMNSVNQYHGHQNNGMMPAYAGAPAAVNSAGPPPPPAAGHPVNNYAPVGSSPGNQQPPRTAPKTTVATSVAAVAAIVAPPPPPPPPAPGANATGATSAGDSTPVADVNSLAAALQAARLKKKQQTQPVENSGSSTSSSNSSGAGNYGTLGRGNSNSATSSSGGGGGGIASMMDEMAKTLARRRAAVNGGKWKMELGSEQPSEVESSPDKKSWDKKETSNANTKFSNGAESPKAARKRFGSASEDTLLKINGVSDGSALTAQELEAFKSDLMKEVRKEFQKIKQEIVDAVKVELSRR